jgi:hypothetical protein
MTDSSTSGSGGLVAGLSLLTDGYERKARLYPALLLFMPIALVVGCGLGKSISSTEAAVGLFVTCGGLLLLAQIARDAGKGKERALFLKWDGIPSVSIFRYRDARVDPITKARCHKKMSRLVKEAIAPSSADEIADPVAADRVYTAWSTYIRVNTRDTRKFPLLFQENINYGYRRNVWGLRSTGIVVTAFSLIGAVAWLYMRFRSSRQISVELTIASIVILILLLLWLFRFTADWVRIPANAYAERLIEAIDSLSPKSAAKI